MDVLAPVMWLFTLAGPAFGQAQITFEFDEGRLQELDIDSQELRTGLTEQTTQDFGLEDPGALLEAFARAAAVSTKGIGVDYASNPDTFVVGAAVGAAVSQQPITFVRGSDPVPAGGYAFMTSLYGGLNLGAFSDNDNVLDRCRVYLGGLGFRTPDGHTLQGRMRNLLGHVQVELVQPRIVDDIGPWAEWGGITATTGIEHARYGIDLNGSLPVGYDGTLFGAIWTAGGTFTIESSVVTIPLELSSNFRLSFFTLYGGLGLDFDIAHASTAISVEGPVDVSVGRNTEAVGTGTVTFDDESSIDPYSPRGFLGAQFNIQSFKLYGHMNFGTNHTIGGFLGLRVAR